ncbi:hypothetical protein Vretimale_2809 [Volvox reticuliferus]|uniref:Peptidylglycine monooxygenase n=1 Tax=Volvox reticuliferus TaxID=1737510 RepID=A0A8J4G0Z9_9CHLO|nr:hypothetical protein Vretimale_2809 [Volvox reticuliferus]
MPSDTGILLTAGILLFHLVYSQAHHIEVNITVPEFKIDTEDAYLCVSAVLPVHPHKLIGVIPHASQEVVHHILLYGCTEPHMAPKSGAEVAVWRCDMMPVCNGPSVIFYGWGRNAPDLQLPEGVGYSVGEHTGIEFIVAQVHYLAVRPPDDHSGVTLVLKPHSVPYAAGMLTYASWFEVPPGKESHLVENTCCFKSYQPLTMFAVRVHTHTLGRQVYMTREAWNHSGIETLYTRDPQLPQSFVPSTRHVLWPGDRLTVTCDFDSTSRSTVTSAGGTHNDEMCNMYVMLYSKTPYLTMCSDSTTDIRDDSPGALPREATLALDPSPFWKPPQPEGLVPAPPGADADGAAEDEEREEDEDYEDYQVDENEGTPPPMVVDPQGAYGDATSVTAGPDGSIWVLYRASGVWQADTFDDQHQITRDKPVPEAVVVQLDPDNGTVLARWGAGMFYLPHMISADAAGNIWVVDTGRHQVLKFTPGGQLLMTVGTELVPGSGPEHFCMPTQVSVLRDGSFLVADGYCNNRVVLFDSAGKFVGRWTRWCYIAAV